MKWSCSNLSEFTSGFSSQALDLFCYRSLSLGSGLYWAPFYAWAVLVRFRSTGEPKLETRFEADSSCGLPPSLLWKVTETTAGDRNGPFRLLNVFMGESGLISCPRIGFTPVSLSSVTLTLWRVVIRFKLLPLLKFAFINFCWNWDTVASLLLLAASLVASYRIEVL